MSQLAERIGKAKAEGRAALIAYLPVGYPDVDGSIAAMVAAVEAGADVIEVGVPYSDPGMDGPVIQQAVDVAVRAGVGMRDVLRAVEAVAAAGAVPVVMSYWNPIERYGVERFATDLAAAGGAGAITPDLIPDEAADWIAAAEARRPRPRLPRRAVVDRGAAALDDGGLPRLRLRRLDHGRDRHPGHRQRRRREAGRPHPGGRARSGRLRRARGLRTGRRPAEVAAFADGVIVGSAYVRELLEGRGTDGVRALTDGPRPRECGHDRPRRHPQPDPGRLGARPAADPRLRAVHRRRHRRRRPGSPRSAGWPAAGRPATCSTSPSGPCRSGSSAAGSTT